MDLATRKTKCRHVDYDCLLEGFRRVGIHSGDTIYCHSSLSNFGYVDGGANAVVDALLASVGSTGTVAAPAGTYSLRNLPRPVLDVRKTPSGLGVISETIRQRSSHRSHHLLESVSALGSRAEELTATHSTTNCGRESPFQKFIAWDAQILLIGVSHNSNTTFEAVEEEMAQEYVGFAEVPNSFIIDEQGVERSLRTLRHNMAVPYDFNRMNMPLIKAGVQTDIVVGESIVRRVSASGLCRVARRAIEDNPYALRLRDGEQRLPPIPTTFHDLD